MSEPANLYTMGGRQQGSNFERFLGLVLIVTSSLAMLLLAAAYLPENMLVAPIYTLPMGELSAFGLKLWRNHPTPSVIQ